MDEHNLHVDKQEAFRRPNVDYLKHPDKELVEKYAALISTPIVIRGVHYLPARQKKD